ncbi:MAG: hypothetical protein H6700_10755 [Myxococcales bacterium]|nr:hypothetical protein [Myxococcales bacterium]MCB9532235.1 hypothetical protein [Myxococcales bacterium]
MLDRYRRGALRRALVVLAPFLAAVTLVGCEETDTMRIPPIEPQTAYVGEFLSVPFSVRHPGRAPVSLSFSGPDLPFLDRWAFIVARPGGGELQWTPTADHVGLHTLTINAAAGDRRASRHVQIEVIVAREAAPVFSAPGPGQAVDLDATPCVELPVVASDRDSEQVALRVAFGMPAGATFDVTEVGPTSRGTFRWCPRADQTAAAAQWTVTFGASDGEHPEVQRDTTFVLLTPTKAACGGAVPEVVWGAPEDGSSLVSRVGYPVSMRVADDNPLRDRPVLFYTDGRIEQRDQLELPTLSLVPFAPTADGGWLARIPTFRLAEDEAKNLSLVAWVTDDDDPTGTRCDNLAPLRMRRFTAIGAVEAGILDDCDVCQVSGDCLSGVCARTPYGGRCIPGCELGDRCDDGTECALWNSMEGVIRSGCGSAESRCLGVPDCEPDAAEPNDVPAQAATLAPATDRNATACGRDDDWYRLAVDTESEVEVQATGAVELQLVDAHGTIVAVAARSDETAVATVCVAGGADLLARVFAPSLDPASYSVRARVTPAACACVDDPAEAGESPTLSPGGSFSGQICGRDTDELRVESDDASRTTLTLTFDAAAADLDMDVLDAAGHLVASARGVGDTESVSVDLRSSAGPFRVRVFSYDGRDGSYTLARSDVPLASCATAADCDATELCDVARCRRVACVRNADCEVGQICPLPSITLPARTCVAECADDGDCGAGRVCKQFFEGAACFPTGEGETAAECEAVADCGGDRVCVDWPGGHCAAAGCDRGVPCGEGAACAMVDGRASCVQTCWGADDACTRQDDYECRELFAPDSEILYGCVPVQR